MSRSVEGGSICLCLDQVTILTNGTAKSGMLSNCLLANSTSVFSLCSFVKFFEYAPTTHLQWVEMSLPYPNFQFWPFYHSTFFTPTIVNGLNPSLFFLKK